VVMGPCFRRDDAGFHALKQKARAGRPGFF
jgi:hypothetical protein